MTIVSLDNSAFRNNRLNLTQCPLTFPGFKPQSPDWKSQGLRAAPDNEFRCSEDQSFRRSEDIYDLTFINTWHNYDKGWKNIGRSWSEVTRGLSNSSLGGYTWYEYCGFFLCQSDSITPLLFSQGREAYLGPAQGDRQCRRSMLNRTNQPPQKPEL